MRWEVHCVSFQFGIQRFCSKVDFESESGKWVFYKGSSFDEIFFGEEDEGGIVGIEGVFMVKAGAWFLGSSIEETFIFIGVELQLWLG